GAPPLLPPFPPKKILELGQRHPGRSTCCPTRPLESWILPIFSVTSLTLQHDRKKLSSMAHILEPPEGPTDGPEASTSSVPTPVLRIRSFFLLLHPLSAVSLNGSSTTPNGPRPPPSPSSPRTAPLPRRPSYAFAAPSTSAATASCGWPWPPRSDRSEGLAPPPWKSCPATSTRTTPLLPWCKRSPTPMRERWRRPGPPSTSRSYVPSSGPWSVPDAWTCTAWAPARSSARTCNKNCTGSG